MNAFETLIYTDCRPGQGLRGAPGLQFQARSPGAPPGAEALVQHAALYEPPSRWMLERRPVPDYPPSLAHAWDGSLYATAAGVYLGREANGGREGNQLTHAIVTADPDSYQLHRPAQLFGAPFWVTSPASTTTCPPVTQPWEPGPFDIADAQVFVAGQPRGADLLEALLTCLLAIGRPGSRRVLFRGEDAAEVLRWVSAATMLIPHRRALRIGFKVFTTNPAYAVQPVVAVHPGWDSTSVTVGDDGGYAVFDLAGEAFSRIEVDPDARRRVRLLFDEDAYDVLDVIEVAAASGLRDPAEAFELARSMVLPRRPLSPGAARTAVSWLRTTPPTLLAPSRGVLVDKLVATVASWPAEVLLGLDEVARAGQVGQDRVLSVRVALLRASLDAALRGSSPPAVALPPVAGLDGERYVLETLRACPDARAVDKVLQVAHRFGLSPDLDAVPSAVEMLLTGWQADPDGFSPYLWGSCGDRLLRELRAELRLRIAAGEAERVGDSWRGRFTLRVPLADDTLEVALLAAEMAYRGAPGRAALVREMLGGATPASLGRTVGALWHRTPPTPDEYALLPSLLPAGMRLPEWMATDLLSSLTHDRVALIRRLDEAGLLGDAARRLLDDDDTLRRLCADLTSAPGETYATEAAACSPAALDLWGDRLVAAIRAARRPTELEPLVRVLPPALQERVRRPGHSWNPLRRRRVEG